MGADDWKNETCSVMVPAELVAMLMKVLTETMWDWHEENDCDVDLMVCSAAVMITAKMFNERAMNFPESGMLQ